MTARGKADPPLDDEEDLVIPLLLEGGEHFLTGGA